MTSAVSAIVGFTAAGGVALAATPVAISIARKTNFLDHPREYRKHKAATPLLGGTALILGFLIAAIAVGGLAGKHVLIGCAVGMWLLGTLDDRFAVPPRYRLLAEAVAAATLFAVGLGWHTSAGAVFNFVLSVVWIAGVVNAFNLMDNLDGACSTVGAVCAAGIGTLAVLHSQPALAGLSYALAGACCGFLPWNLTGPAKIFLGDGGSMPVGFLVAALSMALGRKLGHGDASLLVVAMLAGIPILDTALVSVSRLRRRVTLTTGGRDHLTHRLLLALRTPAAVAAALALSQAALCTFAVLGDQLGTAALVAFALAAVGVGATLIAVFDTTGWRPAGIAVGDRAERAPTPTVSSTP